MKAGLAAIALAFAPFSAAKAMTVADFLTRSDALQKRGAMALFSSELGLLKREVTTAATALRGERLAAQKAGRRPPYCPNAASAKMGSDQLLAIMRAVPPGDRARLQVKDALRAHFVRTQPCG